MELFGFPHDRVRRACCGSLPAFAIGIAALVAWPPAGALAQIAPSQVTPQTLRPPEPRAPGINLPAATEPLKVPPGTEKLNFIAGRVVIEGAFPEFEEQTRTLAASIEGQRVSVTQVYAFANALEQLYARAGYVLVRVSVPPQRLRDRGALKIVVTDGFIEEIQTEKLPDTVRGLVTEQVAPLIGQHHIKLSQIERRLLIAASVPGLKLKSTLARGKTSGGALLVLEGTHQLVTGSVTVDNRLPANLGTWSYGGNLALNSALGTGEQFYVSAQSAGDVTKTFSPETPMRVLGAGAIVPLGTGGFTLNPEYTYSRSNPRPGDAGLVSKGYFERIAARAAYAPIRTRAETLTLTSAIEFIRQSVALSQFNSNLNEDRYSVFRGGGTYETVFGSWGTSARLSGLYSRGLGGRDTAEVSSSGIPLSRLGASPVFDKFNADAFLSQPLPGQFRVDLIGRLQSAFNSPLLASEQLSLDGNQGISAYPNGTLSVDEGATFRGELTRSFAVQNIAIPLVLSPYGFGAVGVGRIVNPTALEVSTVRALPLSAAICRANARLARIIRLEMTVDAGGCATGCPARSRCRGE